MEYQAMHFSKPLQIDHKLMMESSFCLSLFNFLLYLYPFLYLIATNIIVVNFLNLIKLHLQ